jgi:rare lipoprotein A
MQKKLLKIRLKVWRQLVIILMAGAFIGASPALLAKEKNSYKAVRVKASQQSSATAKSKNAGFASFYAKKFHGRRTASGEIFNNNALTAAHKSLPFGTLVKVTNLRNKTSVVVRINDRGPFVRGRIIDLTRSAAKKIGLLHAGTARVKLEVLKQ